MKTMLKGQVYFPIRNIVALTFIISSSGCSGLLRVTFNSSHYTFHENSTEGRDWEESRWLCQNSSEGDLVSIEEEKEQIFVESIIKNRKAVKYFIGLKKEQLSGKWRWLANGKPVDASRGSHPWAPGEPSGGSHEKCTIIYGNYRTYLGQFDDLPCRQRGKYAGYICERAVSCTQDEKDKCQGICMHHYPVSTSTTRPLATNTLRSSSTTSVSTKENQLTGWFKGTNACS
ncbi:C-type lectin domain family 4 member D-like [Acropora muricata]|uniref:C-type lectin domain family 4 member D-like n=1 Tax=Acropora muricata TaxID=159855 RepID=UPI0034E3C901